MENIYKSFNRGDRYEGRDLDMLQHAIVTKTRPKDKKLHKHFEHAMEIIDKGSAKEILLDDDGHFEPCWDNTKERQVFMVTGMSGSGKSHWTSKMCERYFKQYPKNKVILLSNKKEDPVFDKFENTHKKRYIRLNLDEELLEDPIDVCDEFANSLVVMDDMEYSPIKGLETELDRIRDVILNQGRYKRISLCYISHMANDYKKTRNILNECNGIVVFPHFSTAHNLKYLLQKYFGFERKDIEKLKRLPSRWVCIMKCPTIITHSKGCYMSM